MTSTNVHLRSGDLLKVQDVDALVNTVNCVGVMGKGIALQFKLKWPENFDAYVEACKRGDVSVGKVFICSLGELATPKFIVNFPTKEHWRGKSHVEFIQAGLRDLVSKVRELGIRSIAIPPLGAGNGGLRWESVRPMIESAFEQLPDVDVKLFKPNGAPAPKTMEIRTKRPKMTFVKAGILKLLTVYRDLGYNLSKLEVQKLVYFFGAAGGYLPSLVFEKAPFGPYCDKLRHLLRTMDGHFIRGYGDGSQEAEIEPINDALSEADAFITAAPSGHEALRTQLERVEALIDGYQTPYGMELLSTVHWVAANEGAVQSGDDAVDAVRTWSARKRQTFSEAHIRAAWLRLHEHGWFTKAA